MREEWENDVEIDILEDLLEHMKKGEQVSLLEASWICKLHCSIVQGDKDELVHWKDVDADKHYQSWMDYRKNKESNDK